MTLGSLFAGIGGFDLGFERAGFKTVWQVEKNAYCRRVLRRHFPDADRRVTDVRYAGARNLLPVDVICGGFPCQDISNAGLRAGIDGARSGLWFHMHRIIGELRPRYVVVENVAALLGRGMGRVLGDLSEIGYDAEWQVISAADVGAPHLRERIWVVAHPNGDRRNGERRADSSRTEELADAIGSRELQPQGCESHEWRWPCYRSEDVAYAERESAVGRVYRPERWKRCKEEGSRNGGPRDRPANDGWPVEPNVGRVAHGVPARVDRLRALGNAVVPQIPELIARRLKELT